MFGKVWEDLMEWLGLVLQCTKIVWLMLFNLLG